ncbi:cytosolic sulfotransferase 12-like [Andrographis paniculata]|uniref:cytosolic sulfotransferase 12-like n=1 Tax=Andrographis paniculata TaxID=175694 RepID=UPI0021E84BB5|nr:cytosolic sulfotransferase 12-like [Andrographis paniculata]
MTNPSTYISLYVKSFQTITMADSKEKSYSEIIEKLPKARFWEAQDIYHWEGFWFWRDVLKLVMTFRDNFLARNDDVLLASPMKTGTTWLKSLAVCILPDGRTGDATAAENPHSLLPTVEASHFAIKPYEIDIYDASAPRLIHTHIPYSLLPDSIKSSSSSTKIVYIARNPKDTFISMWHFYNSALCPIPLEKAFDCFCSGVYNSGPLFDHMAEYWIESQKRPEKILFMKYEELKSNPKVQISKMAEFLGKPLAREDEVEKILWRCSLERLRNLEVNKNGKDFVNVSNRSFFRKGEVGDYKNYLTPEMEEKIDQMSREKLEAIGLFL